MNRKIIFTVIAGILIIALVLSWRIVVKLRENQEKVESMQMVQELLTQTSIDTTEPIGTTLGGLFSNLSFAINKQRAQLFDAKEIIQNQSSLQIDCILYQDLIDFKLKLNQLLKLYHLKEKDCTGQLDTALNNLSYLNRPGWTFTEPRTIDSVLFELNRLASTLPQLEGRILDCSQ